MRKLNVFIYGRQRLGWSLSVFDHPKASHHGNLIARVLYLDSQNFRGVADRYHSATNPFSSTQPVLTISGACETTAVVTLGGDAVGSTTCENSAFTITVPKAADGDYNITVTQEDLAGNTAQTSLVWRKHVLSISPPNPVLVVNTPQVLTLNGGTGTYTVSILTNNSGGSYDSGTRTYTPGTLANVTDTLQLADSLGASITYNVSTVAGAADHLELPAINGSGQSGIVGRDLPLPVTVRVVDRYGNGIPSFPLLYQVINGDAKIKGDPSRVTNASGTASANVTMGYNANENIIRVAPLSTVLPDLAGSNTPTLTIAETGTTTGRGVFGSVFGAGANPGASVIEDFNGDGYRDVAVLNVGEPSVGVYLGRANGLLGNLQRITPLCSGPNGIVTADFNGDGKKDLAVTCGGIDKVAVILGNGDGTFLPRTYIPMDAGESIPVALTTADFNNDGHADLAVTAAGGALVGVRFGLGNGTFAVPVTYNVGQSPVSIKPIDINKDGNLDLVVANASDANMSILTNDGLGGFLAAVNYATGLNPSALAVTDFDNDGFDDVASVNNGEDSVGIYINDQAGGLLPGNSEQAGTSPVSLTILDFNQDGIKDIAVANSGDSTVSLLEGIGTGGALNPGPVLQSVSNPVYISSGLLNADGFSDLLLSGNGNQEIQVIPGQAAGALGWNTVVGNAPSASAQGDFDEDGKPDAAVVSFGSNNLKILKGDGQGLFTVLTTVNTGAGPSGVTVSDFNGDDHLDVAVTGQNVNSLRVFIGVGDGTFQAPNDYATGLQPRAIITKDMNADGIDDLIVANGGGNSISYFQGVGDGTFNPKADFAAGNGPMGLVASDFNGDQKLDIATVNSTSDAVSVLLGNQDGTFQNRVEYSTGAGPVAIIAGDLNRDGNMDVAVANGNDATVGILLGNGDGSLRTHIGYSCGATPSGIVVGDFNNDQKLDLAVANGSSFYVHNPAWHRQRFVQHLDELPHVERSRRTIYGRLQSRRRARSAVAVRQLKRSSILAGIMMMRRSKLILMMTLLLAGCLGEKEQPPPPTDSASLSGVRLLRYDTSNAVLNVRGSLKLEAMTNFNQVSLHLTPDCSDSPVGRGLQEDFIAGGIEATVPATGTSRIFVATNTLNKCFELGKYVPNYVAPPPPVLLSTSPTSPSQTVTTPAIRGTASGYAIKLDFYDDSNCTSQVGTGSTDDFVGTGITITVQPNQTSHIHAIAEESFGLRSTCAEIGTYRHSTSGPVPPCTAYLIQRLPRGLQRLQRLPELFRLRP